VGVEEPVGVVAEAEAGDVGEGEGVGVGAEEEVVVVSTLGISLMFVDSDDSNQAAEVDHDIPDII